MSLVRKVSRTEYVVTLRQAIDDVEYRRKHDMYGLHGLLVDPFLKEVRLPLLPLAVTSQGRSLVVGPETSALTNVLGCKTAEAAFRQEVCVSCDIIAPEYFCISWKIDPGPAKTTGVHVQCVATARWWQIAARCCVHCKSTGETVHAACCACCFIMHSLQLSQLYSLSAELQCSWHGCSAALVSRHGSCTHSAMGFCTGVAVSAGVPQAEVLILCCKISAYMLRLWHGKILQPGLPAITLGRT